MGARRAGTFNGRSGPPQVQVPDTSGIDKEEARQQLMGLGPMALITVAFIFWVNVFFSINASDGPGDIRFWLNVGFAGACAVAFPLLLSPMIPSTALGMRLLRMRFWSVGYILAGIMNTICLRFAWEFFSSYWNAQPSIVDTGLGMWLTYLSMVFFIGIPALAWTPKDPRSLLREIAIDHQVHKMEIEHEHELEALRLLFESDKLALRAIHFRLIDAIKSQDEDELIRRAPEVAALLGAMERKKNIILQKMALSIGSLLHMEGVIPVMEDDEIKQTYDDLRVTLQGLQNRSEASREESLVTPPAEEKAVVVPGTARAARFGRSRSRGGIAA